MTVLDPERQKQAKEYARIRRRLWLVDTVFSAVYAILWLFLGWASALRNWLMTFTNNQWLLVALFVAIFGGIYSIINLPLGYYSGFVLPPFWPIQPDAQGLGHRPNQGIGSRRTDRFARARIALPCPACDRQSLVAVGRGRDAGFHRFAFQSCPGPHCPVVQ